MLDPFKGIDRWASQSGERASFLMWAVVVAMTALVILAIVGLIWYTAPAPGH